MTSLKLFTVLCEILCGLTGYFFTAKGAKKIRRKEFKVETETLHNNQTDTLLKFSSQS